MVQTATQAKAEALIINTDPFFYSHCTRRKSVDVCRIELQMKYWVAVWEDTAI